MPSKHTGESRDIDPNMPNLGGRGEMVCQSHVLVASPTENGRGTHCTEG
jgi:hypothetical protein